MAIATIKIYLGIETARMNFPSTLWKLVLRMTEDQLTPAVEEGLLDLTTPIDE